MDEALLHLFSPALRPPGHISPIPTIPALQLPDDASLFYATFGDRPLIVRGYGQHSSILGPARDASPECMSSALSGCRLRGTVTSSGEYTEQDADQCFATHFRDFNVYDHPVEATPFAGSIVPPLFFRDSWYDLLGGAIAAKGLSLTLSGAGCFTEPHMDADGMQGWMLLVYGRKSWAFVAPQAANNAWFDPQRNDYYSPAATATPPAGPHANDASIQPERAEPPAGLFGCEVLVGQACGGDLMYIPAGWLHMVETKEHSFGVGGSLVNEFAAEASMRAWADYASRFGGWSSYSLPQLQDLSVSQGCVTTEQGRAQVAAAQQLVDTTPALRDIRQSV